MDRFTHFFLSLCLIVGAPAIVSAQNISLPPSGGNQKSQVIQHMGLVSVSVEYSSPDVAGPNGQSRKGQIWGQLVPYGMQNLGFGTAEKSPWRAGANENTVIEVSHDVLVQGQPLPAGRYGFHMVPQESGDWTLIFSKNSTAWGSYFYDPKDDVLQVTATPEAAAYSEWLTYEFTDRQLSSTTLAMHWEEMRVPFTISVENIHEVYLTQIRQELQNSPGFSWQSWAAAANYCVQNNLNLEEALTWADQAISGSFVGQENFTTLQTKAQVLTALGRDKEAESVLDQAIQHPSAGVAQIHQVARQFQASGNETKALEIYEANAKRFPDIWPTNLGLARAYSGQGDYKKALKYLEKAIPNAPNQFYQTTLEGYRDQLKAGKAIN